MKTMIHTQFKSGIRVLTVLLVLGFHFQSSAQKQELPAEARAIPNFRALWANEPFAKYDPSNEIVEKRDQVSKHFRNADGTVTAHIASGPIHYWEEGQWKTIFHTIEKTENGYLSNLYNDFKTNYPVLSSGSIKTSLPNGITFTDMQGMRMYYEANGQELLSLNIAANAGKSDFNVLTYPSVYGSDIDLRFTQHTSIRKMDYILKSPNALNPAMQAAQYLVFEERITLPEGAIAKLEKNIIFLYLDGKLIASYDRPYIKESLSSNDKKKGNDSFEDTAFYKMDNQENVSPLPGQEGIFELVQIGNQITLKLKVEMSWLKATNRVFPIEVDPSINFTPNATSSWTGAIETARSLSGVDYTAYSGNMWSANYFSSGVNFGGTNGLSSSKIFVGVNIIDYTGNTTDRQAFHSWAKFNTATISDNSTVSSIDLYTYIEYDYSSNVGIDFTKITTEPVANDVASRLTEIRNGTVYNADIQSFDNGGAAWVNYTLGGTANSDLQSLLSSDWFAVGYKSIGRVDWTDDWVRASGQAETNKPYITVTYTSISVPTVTTTTESSITNFTASSGGNVTSDGGASVTARGVLWSTSPGLTMPSASSTSNGASTGLFTSSLTGLSASTVYYYRAYALNSVGYGYGIEYSFATTGPSAEGYYISGNIVNNGEIVSTYDVNYLRMTGTSKTITGTGKFTNSKLFADGSTTFDDNLNAASACTETFVNAGKSLTIATGRTFKNGTMGNYGTLTIAGTGSINNSANWVNGPTGTVTFGGAGTIYAGANWTNDGTFTAGTGTVEFNGATSGNIISGTTNFYNATINKGSSTATILDVNGTVTQTVVSNLTCTNGLLRISTGGSWTKSASGATIGAASGLHVNGGAFTLNGGSITNNGLFKTTTGTATIGNSSGNSITNQSGSSFIIDGAGTVNIAGRMEATGSGSFNQSAGTLNVCTSGNGSATFASLDMASVASFTMTGGAINVVQKSTGSTQIDYKNLAGTVSISGGTLTIGTNATSASSNFNIQGAMPPLIVDNTTNAKTVTINGASTVYGNVTINSTSSLVLNSGVIATVNGSLSNSGTYNATGTLNLAGDWTNNGTFTSNTGNTVVFNGGSSSTISGSGTDNFANLTISKTSSTPLLEVTLGKDATVLGTLTLTGGKLIVNGTKTLYIGNTSANGTISGGSSASYIVAYDDGTTIGKLQRAINTVTSYVFPIGDLSNYTPLSYTLVSGTLSNATLTVYTKPSKIFGLNVQLSNYLNRYWEVLPSGITNSIYNVSFNYTIGDIVGTETSLIPIKKSGSTWYKPTGTSFLTGTEQGTSYTFDAGTNLLSWSGLSTYSKFGGAGSQAVNLPIVLLDFFGKNLNKSNVLNWTTFSELDNDFFTIEYSTDGYNFENIGLVNGAGNSSESNNYEFIHSDYRKEINYYRLQQTDFNGMNNNSELISIDNREKIKEILMTTNLIGQEVNENYKGLVVVVYTDGTILRKIQ